MQAKAYSHIGAVRKKNEDAVFCDSSLGLFIVADGIGGRLAGEVASSTAVSITVKIVESDRGESPQILLKQAFFEANDALFQGGKNPEHYGMGTTMTAAIVNDQEIFWAHVGDSRAYLITKDTTIQLTQDHSLVNELLKEGSITEEEAQNHPQKNILIRSLGQESLVNVDVGHTTWQTGDYLLLCSDGFYNMFDKQEIATLVLADNNIEKTVESMVNLAIERGGFDNISVVLVLCEDGEGDDR
ncbi:MAG: Stp1/IreP family PP2C-type Ser/Thr phosphatase [Bacillota bacterium]|jgi:serine/threonine protein phosphatase PrpC